MAQAMPDRRLRCPLACSRTADSIRSIVAALIRMNLSRTSARQARNGRDQLPDNVRDRCGDRCLRGSGWRVPCVFDGKHDCHPDSFDPECAPPGRPMAPNLPSGGTFAPSRHTGIPGVFPPQPSEAQLGARARGAHQAGIGDRVGGQPGRSNLIHSVHIVKRCRSYHIVKRCSAPQYKPTMHCGTSRQ